LKGKIIFKIEGKWYTWEDVTGLPHPKNRGGISFITAAQAAMQVDERIEKFKIVKRKMDDN